MSHGVLARVRQVWRQIESFYDELFTSRWRQSALREARTQHDTLRALLLLEQLGVENPVAYETLDLVPHLLADAHDWHLRMGRADLGIPGGCC